MAKKTKIVKCMKCKCEFESEIDKMGVPYNRLCEKHRKMTESEAWQQDLWDLCNYVSNNINRRKRSKLNSNVYFENGEWVGYVCNKVTLKDEEVCRGLDEEEVVEKRKIIVDKLSKM